MTQLNNKFNTLVCTMKPGIYKDISNDDYHSGPGISKSGISLLLDSPEKYKSRYIDGEGQETTPAMIIGSATHTAVFEPELFDSEYAVAPKVDKRTKAGKAEYAAFVEESEGKTVITLDDMAQIHAIRNSVYDHPKAGPIVMHQGGVAENSIFAEHESGTLVKVRPDWLIPSMGIIADLKTCQDASPEGFAKSVFNFTYHIQAGMYLSVARAAGIEVDTFLFIAVEKKAPFAVAVYQADAEMIKLGMQEYERGLELYTCCTEHNEWPGYNDNQIAPISLPYWAANRIEG